MRKIVNKTKKAFYTIVFSAVAFIASGPVHAAGEMDQIKNRVISAIQSVSGPLGFIFVFGGVVLIALKLMIQHNNPNRRSEIITGLPWLAAGAILLGSAMLVANLIFNLGQA